MEREIKFSEIIDLLWRRKWLIVAFVAVASIIAYCYSAYFVTPKYTATGTLYVRNVEEKVTTDVALGEINASRILVNTYIEILKSDTFTGIVVDDINLEYTAAEIKDMLKITSLNNTEILQVKVENDSPRHAAIILNSILNNADAAIRIVKAGSATVIDAATVPKEPSSPNIPRNTLIGAAIGALLSILIIILLLVFDVTVRGEAEIADRYEIPVLGVIPTIFSERS